VQYIETSPPRKASAYYAVYRYLLGDFEPYIYRTDDYGKSWKRLTDGTNGILKDWPTRVVREDPNREGLLYAGTEFGMFMSPDNGAHWQSFQLNLPNVPVTDIKIHKNDMVVSTQGRSMWILDDVTPLAQITAQTASQPATLFRPRETLRVRYGGGRGGGGGGGGAGAGLAQYPPAGAMISYSFASAPAGAATLEIADASGKVVRHASSEATTPMVAEAAPAAPDEPDAEQGGGGGRGRVGPAPRLPKNAGFNRFIWDYNDDAGLSLPPGSYTVKLSSGAWSASQPLTLKIDPREAADGITVGDLREQYTHNVKMRDMTAELGRVVARVQQARTRLRSAGGAGADSLAKVEALAIKLLDQPVRYGRPGLQTQVRYLAGMTTRVDQKIGRDAIDRYQVLRKELDQVEAEADRVLGPASRR